MTARRSRMPDEYHPAVRLAATLLLDDVLHGFGVNEPGESIALDLLPSTHRTKIERDPCRWSVAFAAAATRLAEPRPEPATSVAEQLAMHAILTFASEILADAPEFGLPDRVDRERSEEWRDRIYDSLFDDTDFLLLHDPALDGIGAGPDERVGRLLRTVNLAYEDWFLPLPGWLGHPYFEPADPDEDADTLPWW